MELLGLSTSAVAKTSSHNHPHRTLVAPAGRIAEAFRRWEMRRSLAAVPLAPALVPAASAIPVSFGAVRRHGNDILELDQAAALMRERRLDRDHHPGLQRQRRVAVGTGDGPVAVSRPRFSTQLDAALASEMVSVAKGLPNERVYSQPFGRYFTACFGRGAASPRRIPDGGQLPGRSVLRTLV
jgi:hypothetical protein